MPKPKNAVILTLILAMVVALAPAAVSQDAIRIAYIDPLSGPFAATGENGLNQFRYAADAINKAGGVLGRKLEIVPFDNKVSPQESLIQLKKVTGEGIQFVFQGNSSGSPTPSPTPCRSTTTATPASGCSTSITPPSTPR
jgi:branched-chain amino acid transport system substrate-binding protein